MASTRWRCSDAVKTWGASTTATAGNSGGAGSKAATATGWLASTTTGAGTTTTAMSGGGLVGSVTGRLGPGTIPGRTPRGRKGVARRQRICDLWSNAHQVTDSSRTEPTAQTR